MSGPGVLEDLRVIDATTGPVGGLATMVLADFGADVVKVEPPGGDRFRALPGSSLWLRGKRSVELDLSAAPGRERVRELVAGADVLVVSGPPGRAARLGIDAASAESAQPAIVHCSITPWGPRGPYADLPGYDGIVAARGGRMRAFERQLRRDGPVYSAVPVAMHAASQGAVQGIVAALIARERGAGAQRVETSLLQGLIPYDLIELLATQLAERRGEAPTTLSHMGGDLPTLNYHPVMASDGRWLQCGNLMEHLFLSFLDALELLGEMLVQPRFAEPPDRWDESTVDAARDLILQRVAERPADDWMEAFRRNGNVAIEPYLDTRGALAHRDLLANDSVWAVDDPERGRVVQIGPIAELRVTPARPGRRPPRPGEHTREVLAERRPPRPVAAAAGAPPPPGRPLEGVTVLEIATIIAAPLSTTFLADLGARVIKIEALAGDPYRNLVPGGTPGVKTNAAKESICIDLKSREGLEIAHELAARADVLMHNFRPQVAARYGLDERLLERNAGLVVVAANGYGAHGPDAPRPSTHPVPGAAMSGAGYQAAGALDVRCQGLEEIREISRQLMRANESNPDPNTSVVIASTMLLGLLARQRHGVGQTAQVSMLVANAYANADDFLDYPGKPQRPPIDRDGRGPGACYRLYRARDGWVFLAVTTDAEWARLCDTLGRADLRDDPRFAKLEARRGNDAALIELLEPLLAAGAADEWERRLLEQGVACVRADGPSPGQFLAHDPHVLGNGFSPTSTHARFGEYRRWGPLVTVGGPAPAYAPGCLAGDHTDALLLELGYTRDDVARLRTERVVASEPVEAAW